MKPFVQLPSVSSCCVTGIGGSRRSHNNTQTHTHTDTHHVTHTHTHTHTIKGKASQESMLHIFARTKKTNYISMNHEKTSAFRTRLPILITTFHFCASVEKKGLCLHLSAHPDRTDSN